MDNQVALIQLFFFALGRFVPRYDIMISLQ